jgi:hypothetical protein
LGKKQGATYFIPRCRRNPDAHMGDTRIQNVRTVAGAAHQAAMGLAR